MSELPLNLPAPTKKHLARKLPEGWMPDQRVIEDIKRQFPWLNLELEHANFTDYWLSKTGRNSAKLDWNRTWRQWMRTAADRVPDWKRQQLSRNGTVPFGGRPESNGVAW